MRSGLFAALFLFAAFLAHAATPDLRPSWSGVSQHQLIPNSSFFDDRTALAAYHGTSLQEQILAPGQVLALSRQYEDMNRDYELRRNFQLIDPSAEKSHINQMSDFGQSIANQVRNYNVDKGMKRAQAVAENNEAIKAIGKPVAVAGTIVAVYNGLPIRFSPFNEVQMSAHTNFRNQTAGLAVQSPLINSSLDFVAGAPSTQDPNGLQSSDPIQKQDRYRLSFSRGIPLLNLSSGLSYGTSSGMLSTSLSKQLSNHLTCVVDSSKSTNPELASVQNSEETLRFLYGLNF